MDAMGHGKSNRRSTWSGGEGSLLKSTRRISFFWEDIVMEYLV